MSARVNGERENNEECEPPKHPKDGFIYFLELKNHMAFPQEDHATISLN
jgi:hypothetical protein